MKNWIIDKFKIQTYNVGIINKKFDLVMEEDISSKDIVWLKKKKNDRFYADPFLWDEDEENYYILAEEYFFWEEKGKIVLLTVKKQGFVLQNEKIVIDEPYHLSFPYCDYKGDYIMPESSKGDGTYKYYIDNECNVVRKERISDEKIIDGILYNNGGILLGSTKDEPQSQLKRWNLLEGKYKYEGLVENNLAIARNAGKIFEVNERKYRPAQNCCNRYGECISVMIIQNDYDIEEDLVCEIRNPSNMYNETMHTFNVYDDFIIIDGSKDYFRFPMKIIYKMMSRLRKWLYKI